MMAMSAALSLSVFASAASASMFWVERDDASDYAIKVGIQREMSKLNNETGRQFQRQRAELSDLVQSFRGAKEAEIVELFGPEIETKPENFVLPLYESGGRGFSGLFRLHPSTLSKARQSFYQIDNFAGAKVFYGPDGESVQTVIFYFRADETYLELKGWSDLKARIQWEDAHLAKLQQWVAARRNLPTATPLALIPASATQRNTRTGNPIAPQTSF